MKFATRPSMSLELSKPINSSNKPKFVELLRSNKDLLSLPRDDYVFLFSIVLALVVICTISFIIVNLFYLYSYHQQKFVPVLKRHELLWTMSISIFLMISTTIALILAFFLFQIFKSDLFLFYFTFSNTSLFLITFISAIALSLLLDYSKHIKLISKFYYVVVHLSYFTIISLHSYAWYFMNTSSKLVIFVEMTYIVGMCIFSFLLINRIRKGLQSQIEHQNRINSGSNIECILPFIDSNTEIIQL